MSPVQKAGVCVNHSNESESFLPRLHEASDVFLQVSTRHIINKLFFDVAPDEEGSAADPESLQVSLQAGRVTVFSIDLNIITVCFLLLNEKGQKTCFESSS